MKKRNIIEWILLSIVLVLIIPFLIIEFSYTGEQLFRYIRIQIWYINPISILSLVGIQIWRKRRGKYT